VGDVVGDHKGARDYVKEGGGGSDQGGFPPHGLGKRRRKVKCAKRKTDKPKMKLGGRGAGEVLHSNGVKKVQKRTNSGASAFIERGFEEKEPPNTGQEPEGEVI